MEDTVPQHGNATTYNLETVLYTNVSNSEYYKTFLQDDIAHFGELIDVIYEEVTNVEPWMSGNARGPSTAFCILWKMFKMKPSPQQIRTTLEHRDSPYIRALGFLYLRYVADPKTLWKWFERYVNDTEVFAPSGEGTKTVTLGLYVRELLLDQYYFETIFPRIPESTWRQIKENIARLGFDPKPVGSAGTGGNRRGGDDGAGGRRPPSVKAALAVSLGQRAPHVAGGREDGRGSLGHDPHKAGKRAEDRERARGGDGDRDREREKEKERGREKEREKEREREREREKERGRERERAREKERGKGGHRSKSRSRERERDREKRRSRSREGHRDRDRRRSRSASLERNRRRRGD